MRPLKILHVEDSEEEALLFGRACETAGLPVELRAARNGSEAVAYLRGDGKFADREANPLPDLIVLEFEIPGMGGFDFLKWLRHQSKFLSLPVLVFTKSTKPEDKVRAIGEGATGCFTKPKDFETLVQLAESFRNIAKDGEIKNE
jgi:CheY-like chemotaxis protein